MDKCPDSSLLFKKPNFSKVWLDDKELILQSPESIKKSKKKNLKNFTISQKERIITEWIPLLYQSGATPSFVQRHISSFEKIFDLIIVVTFLHDRIMISISPIKKRDEQNSKKLLEKQNEGKITNIQKNPSHEWTTPLDILYKWTKNILVTDNSLTLTSLKFPSFHNRADFSLINSPKYEESHKNFTKFLYNKERNKNFINLKDFNYNKNEDLEKGLNEISSNEKEKLAEKKKGENKILDFFSSSEMEFDNLEAPINSNVNKKHGKFRAEDKNKKKNKNPYQKQWLEKNIDFDNLQKYKNGNIEKLNNDESRNINLYKSKNHIRESKNIEKYGFKDNSLLPLKIIRKDNSNLNYLGYPYQRQLYTEESRKTTSLTIPVQIGFNLECLEVMEQVMESFLTYPDKKIRFNKIQEILNTIDKKQKMSNITSLDIGVFGLISSSMAAAFFSGTWADSIVSLIYGMISGFMILLCNRFPNNFLLVHEFIVSIFVSVLSIISSTFIEGSSYWPTILASTLWILPGFSMYLGMIEIVKKFALPGIVLHLNGIFIALVMGLCFSLSISISNLAILKMDPDSPSIPYIREEPMFITPLMGKPSKYFRYLLTGIFSLGCSIIYRSSTRQYPLNFISTIINIYLYEWFLNQKLTSESSLLFSAFLSSLMIRIYCQIFLQLPDVAIYISTLPLTPGSIVVKAAFSLMENIHRNDENATSEFFKSFAVPIVHCICISFGHIASEIFYKIFFHFPLKFLFRKKTKEISKIIKFYSN